MKKIMKKVLSFALVMIMVCVPLSVMAADNTSPEYAEMLTSEYSSVTVGAGETLYYSYQPMLGLDQDLVVLPADYEGTEFSVVAIYSRTGMYTVEAKKEWDDAEYASVAVTLPAMGGSVFFAITNESSAEETYSIMLSDACGTSIDNPAYYSVGKNTYNASGSANLSVLAGVYAEKDGTVTITMDESNAVGWKYSIQIGHRDDEWNLVTTYSGDIHYSNDSGDEYAPSETVSVSEGDYVFLWIGSHDLTNATKPGEVLFNVTYEATNKEPYTFEYSELFTGSNDVMLNGIANVTIRPFGGCAEDDPWTSVTGRYKITVPSGVTLSVWEEGAYDEETWTQTYTKLQTVSGTSYEFDYAEAYTSILFGFENAGGTVTIERIGDIQSGGGQTPGGSTEYTDYTNKTKPEAFTFKGVEKNLLYVWVEDSARTAVLGTDGFYHLGTANGPILYVDIDMDLHPYSENYIVAGLNKIAQEGRLYNYSTKISYNKALLEYAACKDAKTGLYPVTEDLKEILVQYGTGQGWYTLNGPAYMFDSEVAAENAWLFMCCYEADLATEENVKWESGKANDFVIKIDAEYSDFIGVKVNGKELDKANYTVKEGSTIITISSKYMSALADGKYTISAEFYNSVGEEVSFDTVVTVAATSAEVPGGAIQAPSTGDNSNVAVWAIAMVVAAGAAFVVAESKRRAR